MLSKIVILGPTASGKTDLATELAKSTDSEIISADSRQCYKYLDIGTAKPTPEQLQVVPHYNISILNPDEYDSAALFKERADKWTSEILKRKHHVIYCGGSTLHLRGLIQPFDDIPPSNEKNLELLESKLKHKGEEYLLNELAETDPGYLQKIDGFNKQRIFRALDVYMQTGKPFSSFHSGHSVIPPDDMIVIGLHYPRKKLYNRINARVIRMVESGLVEETKSVLEKGYSSQAQSLQTVGYRQVIEHLDEKLSFGQMVADIQTQTRRYAKRQITWFRRWKFIEWIDVDQLTVSEQLKSVEQKLAAKLQKG